MPSKRSRRRAARVKRTAHGAGAERAHRAAPSDGTRDPARRRRRRIRTEVLERAVVRRSTQRSAAGERRPLDETRLERDDRRRARGRPLRSPIAPACTHERRTRVTVHALDRRGELSAASSVEARDVDRRALVREAAASRETVLAVPARAIVTCARIIAHAEAGRRFRWRARRELFHGHHRAQQAHDEQRDEALRNCAMALQARTSIRAPREPAQPHERADGVTARASERPPRVARADRAVARARGDCGSAPPDTGGARDGTSARGTGAGRCDRAACASA